MAFAQDGTFNVGARDAAMAGASLTLTDAYSLFNNIGGLGALESHELFAGYQTRFNIEELQTVAAGAVVHTSFTNVGAGFYRFGGDLFNQQRIHLAIGNKLQMVSLGAGIDLVQYAISTLETVQVLAIQFGGIAELTPQFVFGAHISNLNQARLHRESEERLPTVMKAGLSYRPSNELMINLEVEKDLDFDEMIKAGIEYEVVEHIFLRTGISTRPFTGAFGFGFHPKKYKVDYAFSNDANLGNIHTVALAYRLGL